MAFSNSAGGCFKTKFHSKVFLRTNTSSQTYTRCGMNACPSNVCNLCSLSGSILNIQQLSRRVLQNQILFKSVFKDIHFKSNLHMVWHECLSVKFCTFDSKAYTSSQTYYSCGMNACPSNAHKLSQRRPINILEYDSMTQKNCKPASFQLTCFVEWHKRSILPQ